MIFAASDMATSEVSHTPARSGALLSWHLLGEQSDRTTMDWSTNEEKSKREIVEVFAFLNPIDLEIVVEKHIPMKP